MEDSKRLLGRRRTLQILGAGLGSATLLAFVGCKDNNKPAGGGTDTTASGGSASTTLDCNTQPDEASKTLRRNLQYKKEAADPEKRCEICAQFQAGKYQECGGCKLISGPVQPKGGCLSFAPREAGAAPATSG